MVNPLNFFKSSRKKNSELEDDPVQVAGQLEEITEESDDPAAWSGPDATPRTIPPAAAPVAQAASPPAVSTVTGPPAADASMPANPAATAPPATEETPPATPPVPPTNTPEVAPPSIPNTAAPSPQTDSSTPTEVEQDPAPQRRTIGTLLERAENQVSSPQPAGGVSDQPVDGGVGDEGTTEQSSHVPSPAQQGEAPPSAPDTEIVLESPSASSAEDVVAAEPPAEVVEAARDLPEVPAEPAADQTAAAASPAASAEVPESVVEPPADSIEPAETVVEPPAASAEVPKAVVEPPPEAEPDQEPMVEEKPVAELMVEEEPAPEPLVEEEPVPELLIEEEPLSELVVELEPAAEGNVEAGPASEVVGELGEEPGTADEPIEAPVKHVKTQPQVADMLPSEDQRAASLAAARAIYSEALQSVGRFFSAASKSKKKTGPLPIDDVESAAEKLVSGLSREHVGDGLVAAAVGAYPDEGSFIVPHSVNVAVLSQRVARHLGLDGLELETLAVSGLLHDVGTVRIPRKVFYKNDSLSKEEWVLMRQRPALSAEIIRALGPQYRAVAEISHQVHERLDGNGYPRGLHIDTIALEASILGAVDIFEAFIHPRPYKKTVPAAAMYGVDNLMRLSHQFGDGVLKALVRSVGLFPVGTCVRLNSGEVARVLRGRSTNPMRPEVEVVCDTQKRHLKKPRYVDLMATPHLYVFKPLSPEDLAEFGLK